MSDDDLDVGTYPRSQYAFFTVEGGQWVFRGENPAEIAEQISELLALVDESEGPGLLSDLLLLKAAGVLKEGNNPAQKGGGGASSSGGGNLPDWVLPQASKMAGREVQAHEIKSGEYKGGPKFGQTHWFKLGDDWVNKPRNG